MTPALNARAELIPGSGIRRVFDLAAELTRHGMRVFPFHLGMPDFDTPQPIKDETIRKLEEGHVHYTPNAGIPPLRRAIAGSIHRRQGVSVDPDAVIVTVGTSEALALALMAVLEPGSELVVPTPCFPTYLQLPSVLGADVVQLPLSAASGFVPRPGDVEALITDRTRAILINTPSNPTGAVVPGEVLCRQNTGRVLGSCISEQINTG